MSSSGNKSSDFSRLGTLNLKPTYLPIYNHVLLEIVVHDITVRYDCKREVTLNVTYRISSNKRPGRLLNFGSFRGGAFIRGGRLLDVGR